MEKTDITPAKDIMTVLRETCHLPEEQLLNLEVCTFESIREIIIDACNKGQTYDVHLLFIGTESEAGTELKNRIIEKSISRISKEVTISPLLIERTAIKTTTEALEFIADNFKDNSLSSILKYFKISEEIEKGVIEYK